jgi:nicotinamidase-related amidase
LISQLELSRHAVNSVFSSRVTTEGARRAGQQTAFLSHSHEDGKLTMGVQNFLHSKGWLVYIDWQDLTMPSSPNSEIANKIKFRSKELDWFIFLATKKFLRKQMVSLGNRLCGWREVLR